MNACFDLTNYRRIHDSLLTRLSNDDDIEKSLSTFANEMTSSAMILGRWFRSLVVVPTHLVNKGLATPDSLILVDELGRGTAPSEGIGISHAIAEELIRRKVSQ
jgi:DNA mismatch repair protein MSH4